MLLIKNNKYKEKKNQQITQRAEIDRCMKIGIKWLKKNERKKKKGNPTQQNIKKSLDSELKKILEK